MHIYIYIPICDSHTVLVLGVGVAEALLIVSGSRVALGIIWVEGFRAVGCEIQGVSFRIRGLGFGV